MDSSRSDRIALLLMAVTVLLWGVNWIIMKVMVQYVGPFDLVVLRYALAFVVMLSIQVAKGVPIRFPPFWLTAGIAVFQTTAFQCLAQFALITGGVGHVAMLAYTMPFWLLLFAWAFLGDRPSWQHGLAFALAGLGLVAIMGPWHGLGGLTSSLLALGSGLGWAIGTAMSKLMFQRHRVDVLNLTTWQMLLGALFTFPFALVVPQQPIQWQLESILGIIYMGVLASALGWVLWLVVVQRVAATLAGMSTLGVPVLTVLLAWLVLGEDPSAAELTGIVLMMLGLVVVNRVPLKHRG